jgi:hypothetical protein
LGKDPFPVACQYDFSRAEPASRNDALLSRNFFGNGPLPERAAALVMPVPSEGLPGYEKKFLLGSVTARLLL